MCIFCELNRCTTTYLECKERTALQARSPAERHAMGDPSGQMNILRRHHRQWSRSYRVHILHTFGSTCDMNQWNNGCNHASMPRGEMPRSNQRFFFFGVMRS